MSLVKTVNPDTVIRINTGSSAVRKFKIYDLVHSNDKILRTKTELFNFDKPQENAVYLAQSMLETMHHYKGLGLAAPQIGIGLRVFTAGADRSNHSVFFNPEILETSIETEELREGCLSFPMFHAKITRPKWIRLKWQHVDGNWHESRFEGLTARIMQHEIDHLDGMTIHDRLGKTSLLMAQKRQAKNARRAKAVAKD